MSRRLPWLSWATVLLTAYSFKHFYSRASAEDLAWILEPTARAVGWLRGETLFFDPGAGWVAPDGSYVIAPACAGVNFLILALTVSVLGFSHRLRSSGERLAWGLGALLGAWILTLAVNTLRILAAVELYRFDAVAGLTPEQAHRLLGAVVYLGALWGLFAGLDRLTARRAGSWPLLTGAVLVAGAYLGMTVGVPLLNGTWRHVDARFVEHAMMVSLVSMVPVGLLALGLLARRAAARRRET